MPYENEGAELTPPGWFESRDLLLTKGFTLVPNMLWGDTQLSTHAKWVYVLLLRYAWREGRCYPGQARLASDVGISLRSVKSAIKELVDTGYISLQQRGLTQTNIYTILERRGS